MQHIVLYALLGVLLFSCYSDDRNRLAILQKSDSLMQQYPDSALAILEGIGRTDTLPMADRAYYALLYTQARDKNYLIHTTDSLIRLAVDYYDSQRNVALLMKSHYYLARVYQDMDSVAASVREFVVAKQEAEEIKDSVFLYLCCSNLGTILKKYDLLDEADPYYKQAEKIAAVKQHSLYLATILINQGEIFIMRGEQFYSQAEEKLLQALKILDDHPHIQLKRFAIGTLASLYSSMERYDEVISYTPQSVIAIASLKDAINCQLIKRYEHHVHQQWYMAVLVILILLAIFLGLFLWFVHRYKVSQVQFKQKLQTSVAECEQSYAQVLTLNKRLEDVGAARDELLRKQIRELPVYSKITSLLNANKDWDVTRELVDIKLWTEIISEVDTLTDGFTTRLSCEYPNLKMPDIRFCCLLKMGFKYSEIGCLLGRTSSMMYKRCGLIAKRVGLSDKSHLKDFIKSL